METSRSTLVLAALVSAFMVGLVTMGTAGATHQNLYQTIMTPPTHADGAMSFNSCGWHGVTDSCLLNQNGNALDWGYLNQSVPDYNVRFRGWLYRSNTSYSNSYLILNVFRIRGGPNECDEAAADVIEIIPWKVRYGMHYVHTAYSIGGGVPLYVSGSGIGVWNSPIVAHMVYDFVGCSWTAYHSHTYAAPVSLSYYLQNRVTYPCCNYGGSYRQNNVEAYQTDKTQFMQGH